VGKYAYFKYLFPLRRCLKSFQPQILHAHYASSYGFIGALSGFHPFVLSCWGTDVMKFPFENAINRRIIQFNLNKADLICATSVTIKDQLLQLSKKEVHVIPFGVDTDLFRPKTTQTIFEKEDYVIGCIKPMEKVYNVGTLIEAFFELSKKYPKMKLLLIGGGSEEKEMQKRCKQLGILNKVKFTGRVANAEIAVYLNQMDVLVNISSYESFGVSVIEALACEKPVVATDTGGLREIIQTNDYGTLVKIADVQATKDAIENYYLYPEIAKKTGKQARSKVQKLYGQKEQVQKMHALYTELLKNG
jgi:glycosyltransferase involved in cell wall biosynthesis